VVTNTSSGSAASGSDGSRLRLSSAGRLTLKNQNTADDSFPVIALEAGDTDIAQGDSLGQITFTAPDEGTGTDAILTAAAIIAISEGDFSSSNNATSLQFATGASAAAAARMSLTSAGDLKLLTDTGSIFFGADSDIELRHVADEGLTIKAVDTGGNSGVGPILNLSTGDTDIVQANQLGTINFQAPDEGTGTDAILVAASITAISNGDFAADANPTSLLLRTSNSGTNDGGYLELKNDGKVFINAGELVLDADGDTSITADTDDTIDFKMGGTDRIQFTSGGGMILTPSAAGNAIFNEGGIDADFRVEGDTSTHAFFVKGDDSNIGMGTDTPDRMGSANTRGVVTIASNSYAVFELVNGDADGDGNVNTINFIYDNNTAANSGQVVLLRSYTDGTQAGHRGGRFSVFTKNNNASGLNEHFRIDKAGNITATDTSIGSISDERLKKNMEDFTYSIDDFKKYKPKKYDWKNPEVHGGKSGQWGFSAQDVEKIHERFVDEYLVHDTEGIKDEDGNQIIHPDKQYLDADNIAKSSKLQQKDAMYISVIQQLITKIETLETKVKALEDA